MVRWGGAAVVAAGLGIGGLRAWRRRDRRADRIEMDRLRALQPVAPRRFERALVADLPEPARRFFGFAIAEGTPLYTVAQLEMEGRFGLGDRDDPGYRPMRATEVLAAPHGFVWAMTAGSGLVRMGGSDSATWTRFWLGGTLPVARFGGDPDHARSAFGRMVAEAVFWTPAAVLPGPGVTWAPVSEDVARVTVRHEDLVQDVDLTVGEDGQPLQVRFLRWSDANPEKRHRLQPFGGRLSAFQVFEGFRLPTHVEAANHFGTADAFPFFVAQVTDVRFPR